MSASTYLHRDFAVCYVLRASTYLHVYWRGMGYRSFEFSGASDQLQREMIGAFEDGDQVRLKLDGLDRLGSDTVRALITLLRRSREVGGDITLNVTKPELQRSLHVLALDRLFTIETTEVAA